MNHLFRHFSKVFLIEKAKQISLVPVFFANKLSAPVLSKLAALAFAFGLSLLGTTASAQPRLDSTFTPTNMMSGDVSIYSMDITNVVGNPAQSGLGFQITLPSALGFVAVMTSNTCGGTLSLATAGGFNNQITLTGGSIANTVAGCSVRWGVTGTAPNTYNVLLANATVTGLVNNLNASLVINPYPMLSKSDNVTTVSPGGFGAFVLRISNTQGAPAWSGLGFSDQLPNWVTPGAASSTCGPVIVSGQTVSLIGGSLALGQTSCSVTIPFSLSNSANIGSLICNSSFPVAVTDYYGGVYNTTKLLYQTGNIEGLSQGCFTVALPYLVKSDLLTNVAQGQSANYVLVLQNTSDLPAVSGFAFTDLLPNIVVPSGAASTTCGGTVIVTGQNVSLVSGSFSAGQASCTVTIPFTLSMSAVVGDSVCNDAGIAGARDTLNGYVVNATGFGSVSGRDCFTVISATPQPVLSKLDNNSVIAPGGTGTYILEITNTAGNPAVSGFGFTDILPLFTVPGTPSTTCGGGVLTLVGTSVTLSAGSMALGQPSCTVSIPFTLSSAAVGGQLVRNSLSYNPTGFPNYSGGVSSSTGLLMATGFTEGVTSDIFVVLGPVLTKTVSSSRILRGGSGIYTLTLTNLAGAPAVSGTRIIERLPDFALGVSGAQSTTCGGTLTSGLNDYALSNWFLTSGQQSCTITIPFTVNTASSAGTVVCNSARFAGPVSDTQGGFVSESGAVVWAGNTCFTVEDLPPLTKDFSPNLIAPNATSTLTFTITNVPGAAAQSGLAFLETLPTDLRFLGLLSNGCGGVVTISTPATNPGTLQLTGGSLAAGQLTCTIVTNVTSSIDGNYSNRPANVTGVSANLLNNAAANITVNSKVGLTKTFNPGLISPGSSSVLTFTLQNAPGNSAVSGLSFTDLLPANVTVVGTPLVSQCNGVVTSTANSITLTGGSMASGVSLCTVSITVTSSIVGFHVNDNSRISNLSVNQISNVNATLGVVVPTLDKAFSVSSITAGQTADIVFTLSNAVGHPANNAVSFVDTLSAGLRVATPSVVSGTCVNAVAATTAVAGSSAVTVSNLQVPAGANCTLIVRVTHAPGQFGMCQNPSFTNNASNISGASNVSNLVSDQCLTVIANPTLTKGFSPTSITLGGLSTLTFTLTNPAGSSAVSNVNFTDTLPSGLRIASPNGLGGTCTNATTATVAVAGTNTLTASNVQVPAAASCTITVAITTSASPTVGVCPQVNNTNRATSIVGSSNIINGVTDQCLNVTALVPTLNKIFSSSIAVGGVTTLTYTITNPASNPIQTYSFTDLLPSGLAIASPSTVGGSCTGGTVTATAGSASITATNRSVPAGAAASASTCTITVNVTTSATPTLGTCPQSNNTNGNGNFSASTNLILAIGNSAAGGGTSTTGACVAVVANPTLTKAFNPTSITLGGVSTLTFTLTNPAGSSAVSNVNFTDTLPSGLRIASPNGLGGTCTNATTATVAVAGTNTLTASNVQVPAAASCTITVAITTSASPTVGVCPQVNNTNSATSIGGTSNIMNGVTDQCLTVNANYWNGVMYDAITRAPIAGVSLTLQGPLGLVPNWTAGCTYCLAPGVFSLQLTGASGAYSFALSAGPIGVYSLNVISPASYFAPIATHGGVPAPTPSFTLSSGLGNLVVQPQPMPPAQGVIGSDARYTFTVNGFGTLSQSVLNNHIPLNPASNFLLRIEKLASRTSVEIGDSLTYTLRVSRTGVSALSMPSFVVVDTLPAGFTYIPNTSKINGLAYTDIALGLQNQGATPLMTMLIPVPLPVGSEVIVTYRVRVGAGAAQGNGVNRVIAKYDVASNCILEPSYCSNPAQAKVLVSGGVFTSQSCVVGKIYADCNRNWVQDDEEIGIPGVRIYLLDGTSLVTDVEGKYSICDLKPKTHVIKVDKTTMPISSLFGFTSNRNAMDGGSMFVDLKMGELFRADFTEASCSNRVIEQIKARRAIGEVRAAETEKEGSIPALKYQNKLLETPIQTTDSANQRIIPSRQ